MDSEPQQRRWKLSKPFKEGVLLVFPCDEDAMDIQTRKTFCHTK